jgi:predicted DNA-binding mobile mystery protein A
MTTSLHRLRLEQTERALAPFAVLRGQAVPPGGWLRAVREALGRSLRTQASRAGVNASTLYQSEAAESTGRITLAQLRKLAESLDCEVVYALVPREPLSATVQTQAERRARQEVLGVAHSMGLEAQRPSDPFVERQIAQRREALLAGSWSKLWQA